MQLSVSTVTAICGTGGSVGQLDHADQNDVKTVIIIQTTQCLGTS